MLFHTILSALGKHPRKEKTHRRNLLDLDRNPRKEEGYGNVLPLIVYRIDR